MTRMGERRIVRRVLVGKPEGRRPLGRLRFRWDDDDDDDEYDNNNNNNNNNNNSNSRPVYPFFMCIP